jgi:hypothetical protein
MGSALGEGLDSAGTDPAEGPLKYFKNREGQSGFSKD